MAEVRIGTSGWSYDDWQGIVYPHGTPSVGRLADYVKLFDTVEVNSSYYHWPRDAVFPGWKSRLPDGFVFTVKAPRGLSHSARLAEPDEWIERIRRGMGLLGDRCGLLLVQLPPSMTVDIERLDRFLALAAPHLRIAMEFRNPSWLTDEIFGMLERRGAAYCVMSGANLPCVLRATAGFVYVRMHGPDEAHLYAGSYSDNSLAWWAERIHEWTAQSLDVYVYFNNDYHGNAVRNALTLRRLCGV